MHAYKDYQISFEKLIKKGSASGRCFIQLMLWTVSDEKHLVYMNIGLQSRSYLTLLNKGRL